MSATVPHANNNKALIFENKKRRSFTVQEDCLLSHLVRNAGLKNWDEIAAYIPGRTARQCKERWNSYLNPLVNNGPWTKDEDNLLYALTICFGKHWAYFTRFFHGRCDNNIKNRWYSVLSKRPPPQSVLNTVSQHRVNESFPMVCEKIEESKAPVQKKIEVPSYEDMTVFSSFDPESSPFEYIEEPIGNDLSLEAFSVVDF